MPLAARTAGLDLVCAAQPAALASLLSHKMPTATATAEKPLNKHERSLCHTVCPSRGRRKPLLHPRASPDRHRLLFAETCGHARQPTQSP